MHESQTPLSSDLSELFQMCGGRSYNNGVYRVHTIGSSIHWSELISDYFPNYKGKIVPFGFDWMGRQFCIKIDKPNMIYMFDPATAEDFELKESLEQFHNHDLVFDRESILSENSFHDILKLLNSTGIQFNDCVGYKVPLFLNGEDSITNYEITNTGVYWEFQRQIYTQIKDLPDGTKINEIKFNGKS